MKKNLLLAASLFFGVSTFAQFEQSNAPVIGDSITLYILDSLAPSYSSETGANATWDYSQTPGFEFESREYTALDPASTGNVLNFPSSTLAQHLEGLLLTFSTNTATERVSQGFVYNDTGLGNIVAIYDTPQVQTHGYPMSVGSPAITTNYTGSVYYSDTTTMTGKIVTSVDGKGTLKLATNTYTDVLRYKTVDTAEIVVPAGLLPFQTTMELTREQYEYYNLADGELPIFIHVRIKLNNPLLTLFDNTIVLSSDQATQFVSVAKNDLENTSVYPNPTNDNINIQLPSSIEKANVIITDALGREVYTSTLNSEVKTINVSNLNKGMYFVNISNDVYSTTKNVVIK